MGMKLVPRPRAAGRVRRGRASVSRPRATVDRLEPRTLLAGSPLPPNPFISEFLAVNGSGITDKDGQRSDWIELRNPTAADVNLNGYSLTDDAALPGKWKFPAVTLPAGGHLLVFASGKDVRTGSELHTNFSLDAGGEYLALVAPGGTAADVLSEYAPYPEQLPDVSYGLAVNEDVTTLIGPAAPVRVLIPADNGLGTTWTGSAFVDTGWRAGTTGVGYDTDTAPPRIPGFSVHMVDLGDGSFIGDLRTAEAVLDGPLDGYVVDFDGSADGPVINLGSGGAYGSDRPLPNNPVLGDPGAADRTDYALRATADVTIPAGDWTIDVNSDDGFLLRIPGVTFISRFQDNSSNAEEFVADDTLMYAPPRGARDTWATFTVPAGGLRTTVRLDFYERGGDDNVELSVAGGHFDFFNPTDFTLLSDGVRGWSVKTTSSTPVPDFNPLIGTDVRAAMQNVRSSAYVRVPFSLDESAGFDELRMRIKYDDGFVAYLNGAEVARRNAPAALSYNAKAAAAHPDAQALAFEDINLSTAALRPGNNVLAIHGLNDAANGLDFLVLPELRGVVYLSSAARYFPTPTPRLPNPTSDLAAVVSDTRFSRDHGFYDAPFDVAISTDTPGAQIRYTTDGSDPAGGGTLYTGPVHVTTTTVLRAAAFKAGMIPSDTDTQTYLFLRDVIRQDEDPPAGFPRPGDPGVHWDYGMDPMIVDNPAYSATIINDLKSIPAMSLVMEPEDLFGRRGIYTNPGGDGQASERPGSAELFYADGTRQGFQVDAGVRIYGGVNRSTSFPKHTFRLLFKTRYGESKLHYPLFDGMPGGETAATEFDTLILRGNFNKSWPFWSDYERQRAQYIHDHFMSATQLAMGRPSMHGTWVHLYLNGQYWGLYNPVERPDAAFSATYLGGDKDEYDALNSSQPVDGTKDAWSTMQQIAAGGLSSSAAYAQIQQYLDVDNLADYMIMNIYGGNHDWDDHNWYASRRRSPDGRFRFYSWDAERTLEELGEDITGINQFDKPSFLYAQLRENPEFRLLFADHVQQHLVNPGGALTPAENTKRYTRLAAVIDRAIVGESARWGDAARLGQPYTRDDDWVMERDRLINEYFPARTNEVIEQFRANGLYTASNGPLFSQQGGMVSSGFKLTITKPPGQAGDIYYTLDGSDPRLPGGAPSPAAVKYTAPVALNQTTTVRARIRNGAQWSAANKATFTYDMAALRVTEVMYHPADPPAGGTLTESDFEFVEVQNTSSAPLFVGGVRFREGIDFTFGNLTLAAGQRAVVVRNLAAFQSRYGTTGITVAGTFTGALDNNGERLRLEGALGQTILDFSYDDDWYPQTDGEGYSLVVINPAAPALTWGEKESWRASQTVNGGPGAADPGINPGAVVVNEALTAAATPGGDFIELHNTTAAPVDVSGWFLSDTPANLRKYRIPANSVIAAGGYLVFTEAAHYGTAFTLGDLDGAVYLTQRVGAADVLGGYRDVEPFTPAAPGVSFGRYTKSTGGRDFTALAAPTPGAANAAPLVGPVVINEIMYNAADGRPEFVELYNLSGAAVSLSDAQNPPNPWRFTDGIDFAFPAGATIPAFGYALVVPVDPAAFRQQYTVPPGVAVFGPYLGGLSDGGERITFARPGTPRAGAPGGPAVVPYVLVDRITYQDTLPWPTAPDGTGPSLARVASSAYGNDAANWRAEGGAGSPGRLNFDAAAPVADVLDVLPDPRSSGVDSIAIRFDEPVRGVDLADLSLTRNNGANLLAAAQAVTSADGVTWTLSNLGGLTGAAGTYVLTLKSAGSGIADYGGRALAANASDTFVVNLTQPATVAGRWAFYNNSSFDGNDPAATAADDAAVAADKSALLPGAAASTASVTPFTRGLNGIMIDVAGLRGTPAAADFVFKTGNDANPAGWALAPAPAGITRRAGAGVGGSDRVTVVWGDNAVKDAWLQVTLKPNALTTGLAAADVFYFGNLIGDTADSATVARVNSLDLGRLKLSLNTNSPVTGRFDFNRDGRVSALDVGAIKAHLNRTLTMLAAPAGAAAAAPASQPARAAPVPPPAPGAVILGAAKPARVWDEARPDPLA
jgi:hypothetical protein